MSGRIPLVLVPGLLLTGDLWRDQIAGLADRADTQVTTAQSAHERIGAIAAAILAAAPPRFALCGLSLGGYVAFEIMRQAPECVLRLALLDTAARADTPEQRARREKLIGHVQIGKWRGVTRRLLEQFIHPERMQDEALIARLQAMAQEVGRDGFVRQQRAIMDRPDSRPGLGAIRCPTLVLCGRQDALTPPERSEEIAAGIAGSRLVVIEDCGHLAPMERPGAVTAALRAWLGG